MRISFLTIAMLTILLGGCAELNSIHHTNSISDPQNGKIITVDAKQRHLLIMPELNNDLKTKWRVCAEAAPDVFSAYAASGGAKGDKSGGELSFGAAETAATIERTQTINLLRESMYRTCERYLSGALQPDQFIIQAARDQRSLVAVLAIEQLTGAIRAKPTIISGPSTSASIVDGEEAAKLVREYSDAKTAADKSAKIAGAAFVAANEKGKCSDVDVKPDSVDAKEWSDCVAAKVTMAQKDSDLKLANSRLDKMLDLAGKISSQLNASTTAGQNVGDSGASNKPSDGAIIAVAQSIENIVLSPGIDEPLMFCIAYLGGADRAPAIIETCSDILKLRAKSDEKTRERILAFSSVRTVAEEMAANQGNAFNAFQEAFLAKIDQTNILELPRKMEGFEKKLGIDLGLASKCLLASDCKNAFQDSSLDQLYWSQSSKIEEAFSLWNTF